MSSSSILCAVLVAVLLAAVVPVAAQNAPGALEECEELYWEGRFEEAVGRLRLLAETLAGDEKIRAYEILGRSCVRMGDRDGAAEAFKSILGMHPEWKPDRQMIAEPEWDMFVEAAEQFRNENLGSLNLRTTPSRAQIFLDNESQAGLTPFTLERLPAGEHQIRLEKDGYLPMETVVTVIASEITVLEVELTADGEAAPPAPFWKKRWARITGGVLGAGLIYVLMSGGGDDVPEETGNPPEELPDFPGPPN